MEKPQYLKIVHPTQADIDKMDEIFKLIGLKEPFIGPIYRELAELIKAHPENELFYWKMAVFTAFSFYKKSEEQLLKISHGQTGKQPASDSLLPIPTKIYPTTTFPPRPRQ